MAVKLLPEYDSLDLAPEPLRDAFAAGPDGKFRLAKEVEIETLPDVAGLKRTLEKFKGDYATASGQIATFQTEKAALETELETLRKSGGSAKEKQEVIDQIAALKQGQAKALKEEQDKSGAKTTRIHTLLKDTATDTAVIASGTNSPKALRPHIMAALRVLEDPTTGKESIVVVGPDGKELYNTKTGNPMTPAEYALSLADDKDFKHLFPGTGMSGGDAKGSTQRATSFGKKQVTREQLKNAEFYNGLRAEAKLRGVAVQDLYDTID